MKNENTVFSDKKVLSLQELKNNGYTQYKIKKLVDEGKLIKLNKSYYENAEYKGEESDFYYLKAYAPQSVVCLLSAAVFHNLSTYIPEGIDIAIPRKAKISSMPSWPQINLHYFTDERYSLGVMVVEDGDNVFQIYDKEKTVVDIVFYREIIGIEETKEVLLNYLNEKQRNLNKLLEYAKLMKCEKVMRNYLEVLI